MKTEHTPEPWRTDAKSGFPQDVHDATGNLVAACSEANFGEANARRIVACVNACAGISIESLEAGGIGSILSLGLEEQKRGDMAERERDELLEAAEVIEINAEECLDFDECTAMLVPIDDYHKLMHAIASVKENGK